MPATPPQKTQKFPQRRLAPRSGPFCLLILRELEVPRPHSVWACSVNANGLASWPVRIIGQAPKCGKRVRETERRGKAASLGASIHAQRRVAAKMEIWHGESARWGQRFE